MPIGLPNAPTGIYPLDLKLGLVPAMPSLGPDPLYDIRNPTYGATGNGVTDDTAAINTAIAAANTTGGIVLIPPGAYRLTSALTPVTVDGVSIVGAGSSSILRPVGNFDVITFSSPTIGVFRYGARVGGLFIDCNNSTGGNAIRLNLTYGALVDWVRIDRCRGSAVLLDGPGGGGGFGAYTAVRDCFITNGIGAGAIGVLTNNHEHSEVARGLINHYNSAGAIGIKSQNSAMRFRSVDFDDCDTGIALTFCDQNLIDGCVFDRGITRFIRLQGSTRSRVMSNTFSSFNGSGSKNVIDVDSGTNASNIVSKNNMLNASGWTNWVVEAGGTGGTIGTTGNLYEGNQTQGLGVTLVSGVARSNPGYNPKSGVTTPGFPATTVAVTNTTGVDVMAYIVNGTNALTVQVDSDAALMVIPASQTGSVWIPAGSTFTPTYGGGAPTWKWKGN